MKKQPTTEEILARLDAYSRRLHGSVEQATSLHAVFWRLNKAALKAKKRDKLWGPLAGTFNIIQHALLRELILIIVRVLDKPRNLETSDKISFVVIGRWLERCRPFQGPPVYDPSTGRFTTTLSNNRGGIQSPKRFLRRSS